MRVLAMLFAVVLLLAGVSGLIPAMSPMHMHPGMVVTANSRLALGLFPVNGLHDLVHVGFGICGLLATRTVFGATFYARSVALIYALLVVLGLIPATSALFGLVPIGSNDVWLHVGLAVVATYFGFIHVRSTGVYARA